jgi:hypothetical protein
MIVQIEIPDYEGGLRLDWEPGFIISVKPGLESSVVIRANTAGLISLARHLLLLAQPDVPIGDHYHFDSWNTLEKGSIELITDKTG